MILGIYGSGGCGREARELADILGTWEETVFIDDTVESGIFKGLKRMPFEIFCGTYDKENTEVIIALGETEHKRNLYNKVKEEGYAFANLIHPGAWISPSAKIGRGIILKAGSMISCDTAIGDNIGIESFVTVGHDCAIGAHCYFAPGVFIGGRSEIGSGTYIGTHVAIKEKTKIGSNSVVGMGSVVQRDIPDNVIALGNPARPMKQKDEGTVFK